MSEPPKREQASGAMGEAEAQDQLAAFFKAMPHPVPIVLFADPIHNQEFSEAARRIIRAIRQLTDKITLREHGLDHELARKWEATRSPTLLFAPEEYRIRWLGAPLGHETQTLMELLSLLGYRDSGLGNAAAKMLGRIKEPRQIKVFVSPSCPYCPQQAVNALRAVIERPDLISVEIIDIQANPVLADQYDAYSVPQTFANEKLIARGAQPEELFMASLDKLEQVNIFIPESDAAEVATDLVIVGGGPAGLTAGIYAARSGLAAVVVEKGMLGGQVATTPLVENYPGFTQVGGKTLTDIMVSHALQYVKIFPGEEVLEVVPGAPMMVQTTRRRFTAKAVLLATGAVSRRLGVPGEERLAGRGVSYCSTCDGPLFKGKKVIMVGGGNSAVTEALHLHQIGCQVTLVHRRDTLRAQEQLVKTLQQSGISLLLETEVAEIRGDKKVSEVVLRSNRTGTESTLPVAGVFIAIGYDPAVGLARKLGLELTADGYIKRDEHHRTSVPGIYCAGDVEGGYKQIVTAAGQGSEAALAIFEDLVNPYWKKKDDQPPKKR
ncbi:MAG: FAD-dependent oxidoreductase [Thermodesulfobacteriota bacterium]